MTKRLAGIVSASVFCASLSTVACAEPVQTSFALTVNALSGRHEVDGGRIDRLTFAPLPLAELTLRARNESLRLEGLPTVKFGYGSSGDGAQSTQLSIVTATYRHAFRHGFFAGIGQTVYNQLTTYVPTNGNFYYSRGFIVDPINGSEQQYSRVTGVRFELGQTIALKNDRIEYWAAVNPKMRGIQYTRIPTFLYRCPGVPVPVLPFPPGAPAPGCTQVVDTFADPENGSQVDIAARVAHRVSKHGELLYGLRYLNYTAHYDDFPGQLADRNIGFAPTLGYRFRF